MQYQTNTARDIKLAIGICLIGLALFDLIQGKPSEPVARWQWLSNFGSMYFNGWGYTITKGALGIIFLLSSTGILKKTQKIKLHSIN